MASIMMRTFVFLAIPGMLMAATYNVGGSTGWDTSSDMQTWASSQTFTVGDSLVFQYTPNHNVNEVSKSDYDNCVASNAVQSYSGGNTAITLSSLGKRYFICGTAGHCSQGMKLEVDILAASAPPTTSPVTPPASPVTPVSSPAPTGSAPAPNVSPVTPVSSPAPTESPPSSPLPSAESPSNTPSPSGLSPIPPPPSSAHKCSSFTVAFGLALMMLFAL